MNASTRNHLRNRLLKVALEEVHKLLKPLKKTYPELKVFTVAFQDSPNKEMLRAGVKGDADSYYAADQQELAIFLFNLYEQDKQASEFKRRVRAALLRECGDLTGQDLEEGD